MSLALYFPVTKNCQWEVPGYSKIAINVWIECYLLMLYYFSSLFKDPWEGWWPGQRRQWWEQKDWQCWRTSGLRSHRHHSVNNQPDQRVLETLLHLNMRPILLLVVKVSLFNHSGFLNCQEYRRASFTLICSGELYVKEYIFRYLLYLVFCPKELVTHKAMDSCSQINCEFIRILFDYSVAFFFCTWWLCYSISIPPPQLYCFRLSQVQCNLALYPA